MKARKDSLLAILGIVFVGYWLTDFYNNAVLPHDFSWIFWYSSAGFLMTGIALILQNIKLIYSLFCALFVIESLWFFDLIYTMSHHSSFIGLTAYILTPSFHITNLYLTLYHIFIPLGLLLAVHRSKQTYHYGWIGATLFALVLVVLTYFLTGSTSHVNCIHSMSECNSAFSFLYKIANPYRTILALTGLMIFVYIPTNYLLLYCKKAERINLFSFRGIQKAV